MLGILNGTVVHGRGKGADAGFPTANLELRDGEALPPMGVYAVRARFGGQDHAGVTNVGLRPTADDDPDVTVETWIPGLARTLYGEELTLSLIRYLRPTRRFPDLAALRAQIGLDAREAEAAVPLTGQILPFFTFSAEETRQLAQKAAQRLSPGAVWVLRGDLGAGKSEFARGAARGLGVTGPVPSPSFTILNVYDQGRLPLYHFDWYRVSDEGELDEIGTPEYLLGDGVCLVEWAEKAESLLPEKRVEIRLQPIGENARLILFEALGGAELPFGEDELKLLSGDEIHADFRA